MKLSLSSKAKTLVDLKRVISTAEVLPILRFNVSDYGLHKDSYLKNCLEQFHDNVIVRSSSTTEDNSITSNAGSFESILDVRCEFKELDIAITKVINSYGQNKCDLDEVFIQPMLKNVTMSGVVFTADMDTLAPYYIVNYDESGKTNCITSGIKVEQKTFISFKNNQKIDNPKLQVLINSVKECEKIFGNNFLDIEFAFCENTLYILQIREIVRKNKLDLSSINLDKSLHKLDRKIMKLNSNHPKLLGNKTIFGVMPDWNPAEIIGLKPKKLALSLYKELITDEIWAYQRDNYGYRNLRSFPLLVSFLGVPYIDVRVSFNSFIPQNLHDNIASKLVNYYLDELSLNSKYHDKIEFIIVYSCYYFGIDKKLQKLKLKNFRDKEIKLIEFELLELTNNVIDCKNGLYKKDLEKIELLKKNYQNIINSNLSSIDKIYWLIEDCKRYGTLPFAGIARAAFIAMQFLNSFVEEGIINEEDKNRFLNSLNTISKQLSRDNCNLSKDKFIMKYGHLRPGTYEICSKRYDEAYDEYFEDSKCKFETEEFIFSKEQMNKIDQIITLSGLKCNSNSLLTFIKESIEGREYAKFSFTKNLSQILTLIEELGKKFEISKEELSYLDIRKLIDLYSSLDYRDVKDVFMSDITNNKEYHRYTQAIKLPNLIVNNNDIYSFFLETEEPNFVTLNSISSNILDVEDSNDSYFNGKIICIKAADPGYDYLFSKSIGGLVTCYGGVNSHMAIRCAELGIPAVIGCGESLYQYIIKANIVLLDAANKQIKVIS